MDAPDAEADVTLRKLSADLITDIDGAIRSLVRGSRRRHHDGRVRARMETATTTLDMFQELPQLLDPHLSTWIPLLADAYLSGCRPPLAHALCRLLYALCKVRGERVVVRFLPVDIRCLELLLGAIETAETRPSEGDDDGWRWEQRYVVLLWISHLLLAPFDLATVSSADVDDHHLPSLDGFVWPRQLPSIAVRLTPLAVRYLAVPGKEHDAAKALLVRLALRRDMQQLGLLDALLNWALASLQPGTSSRTCWFYLGVLSLLAGLLTSAAETSDMDARLQTIFGHVHRLTLKEDELSRTLVSLAPTRKTILKVMRCVTVSLLQRPSAVAKMTTTDVVETTIGHLLESLADNDTPVRLAASKALSLVTLRLAPVMASQVIDAVLDALDRNVLCPRPGVRDLAGVDPLEWHGLMLTLSHLLFRRSPPASQLAPILQALRLGLSFEKRSTAGGSVGANVRDAACFGVWAAARRYRTDELLAVPIEGDSTVLQLLATDLVVTASLDPAGNIRRGASAALQELIGRHPDVVRQGIALVQTVDYHAVARRSRAVADVAVSASRLSACYADALVDGMLDWRGVGDAHAPWRRAAAAVFGLLAVEQSDGGTAGCRLDRLERSAWRLIRLMEVLARRRVQEQHGLLLCFASVVDQLVVEAAQQEQQQQQQQQHQDDDNSIPATSSIRTHEMLSAADDLLLLVDCCHAAKAHRKPELVAEGAARLSVALCPLMQAVTLPRVRLRTGVELLSPSGDSCLAELRPVTPTDDDVSGFLSRLRAAVPFWLSHNEPETIEWASPAALMLLVFSSTREREDLLRAWADIARRKPAKRGAAEGFGYFRALGLAVPLAADGGSAICEALVARWEVEDDIDTKVALLASLVSSRVVEARPQWFVGLLEQGLGDYTTNARGDVGSHVRVEALRALRALWKRPLGDDEDGKTEVMASLGKLLPRVLSLAAERLDRVRPEAQAALALALERSQAERLVSLGHSSETYFSTLLRLASADGSDNPWLSTRAPQPNADEWAAELLVGLVTSADTGNDDLVVASRAALSAFCSESRENLRRVCAGLVRNMARWRGADRVLVPTMDVTAFLFHRGLFHSGSGFDAAELCRQTQRAGYRSGNVRKLIACIRLYGGVAATGEAEARRRLGAMLAHPWPRVRSAAIDEVWMLLTTGGGNAGEDKADKADKAQGLLGVDWAEADGERMRGLAEALGLGP
ncbi:beta-tubulin cofactor d [Ophiocordyceps camponoti-floridani]|uniref:Beta-tubulin cofactor d n=1 Tax=Ophiocordyceps camponoti-floridani TaxID=2030778 RepID=A0A8H4QB19_9HYPO|nr:beta-tubulin cofactor d [Ophiocordyceps camponoti-floridani]